MSVAFKRGTTTGPGDLNIVVQDSGGTNIDPYRIEYAIFDYTTGVEVLMGSPVNIPIKIYTGNYYAQVPIAANANIGNWRIRWTIQEEAIDPVYQSVMEFNVVGDSAIVSFTGDANTDGLLHSLRILLRDNSPDKYYRFRPPESERFIQGQTQVFGYIWEDEELLEFIYMAIDDFNSRPPVTGLQLQGLWGTDRRWRTSILMRAGAFAMFAVTLQWIANEFDYSISGVSLNLEKSSKYQSMKDEFINEYDKLVEAAKRSIKIVKGLQQFKYGIGITSALGPLNRQGVQSRRNWVSGVGG